MADSVMSEFHDGHDTEWFNAVEKRFGNLNLDYGPPAGTPKAPRSMLQGGSPFVTSFGRPVLTAKSRKPRLLHRTPGEHLAAAVAARRAHLERAEVEKQQHQQHWQDEEYRLYRMADVERRNGDDRRYNGGGGRGGGGGYDRKRRARDDDEYDRPRYDDRRPQRRRYEDPPSVRVRKQILEIAQSPLRDPIEDCAAIAKNISEAWEDEKFKEIITDNVVQLVTEQPLKIPYVAAIILYANEQKADIAKVIIERTGVRLQAALEASEWRSFKLLLRFLVSMHGLFEADGAMPLLDELFNKAADLQTESNDDALGLELVKIIMLTIPYMLITSTEETKTQASELLGKTEIIALTPLEIEALVAPYTPSSNTEDAPIAQGLMSMLQKQLQGEADNGWPLVFIPRLFKPTPDLMEVDGAASTTKHTFPAISIPQTVQPGMNPPFPEVYFSVYADQDIETVPATTNLAATLVRDALVDTIDALHFNRYTAAKLLIDLDCYFTPKTFIPRATPFDKVKDLAEDGKSTWKPEDLAIDAVFSLIFRLPTPEHKLIYYHSIITETCKIAPGSIAPSLGRAIRFLYKNLEVMDVELLQRFVDWFSHHLSNFDFRWKWAEWIGDVELSSLQPKKAFILGSIEKEMRLSFANRVRGTLPEEYHVLISTSKDNEIPDYKYNNESTPHAVQAKELISLFKRKAPDSDIDSVLATIDSASADSSILASTDAYVTSLCYIGSKSLSHVLSYIERSKDRLTAIGHSSPAARAQIITSVVAFWRDVQAGVAVNIVDKLLNYTILTPSSVVAWALDAERIQGGRLLAETWIYEMVERTINKVVGRVRQIVAARMQPGSSAEQVSMLDKALVDEVKSMRLLFEEVDDALAGIAQGAGEGMLEDADTSSSDNVKAEVDLATQWGVKWRRVWARRLAVEETRLREAGKVFPGPAAEVVEAMEVEGNSDGAAAAEAAAAANDDDIL